jgi:hypothetical protein
MSCALVTSTDLEKDLDDAKEVTRGVDAPSTKMADQPAMVCGHSTPRDEGRSPPARYGSPCTRGRGTRPARALSPCPMIGKEHRSVISTCPTTGIPTLRKVTIWHQHVVPLSSSDDDLSLVKHEAWVDLNPSYVRIRYTQDLAVVSDSPRPSPPPYIVSGQRVVVGCGKVFIFNPEYKGKDRTESATLNLTPRVQRCRLPPRISGPPRTMEFSGDDIEEEKEDLSNELMASLKWKINTLEEQVAELYLAVYDQQEDCGLLRKATTSKLKRFAKSLGDPSLYNAPSPSGNLEKFGNNLGH